MLLLDCNYLISELKNDVELNRTLTSEITLKSIMAASKNLFSLKKIKKEIYKIFSTANEREKEDIILALEDIKGRVSTREIGKGLTLSIRLINILNQRFLTEFLNLHQSLKDEFYGDLKNRHYTKEELKSISDKFKDFPKDIIQGGSSDLYSDKYL